MQTDDPRYAINGSAVPDGFPLGVRSERMVTYQAPKTVSRR